MKCKYCNKNASTKRRPNATQCGSCAVSKRRHKRKKECVDYLGGECLKSGWGDHLAGLSFHHRNPSEKEFELNSNGLLLKWEAMEKELNKCDLLCVRCHAVKEAENQRKYF